jgi:type V secretory pathway adhesin AidA
MKSKILLLVAAYFCLAFSSHAQIKTGRYLLGGSGNYYNTSNPTQVSFYTNVQVGKVLNNNTVIGLTGTYSSNNFNSSYTSPPKTRLYYAGFFYRKYKPILNKFYFFGEVNASYSYSKYILEYYNNNQGLKSKSSGVNLSFIPGISYNVWKRMQMELTLPSLANISYTRTTTIDSSLPPSVSPQKRNTYTAGINLNSNILSNFAIGFKFFVGK